MENNNTPEALRAIRMALRLEDKKKGFKLFQKAVALKTNDSGVLLHCGEFLESCNNVIDADHFYLKALIRQPDFVQAMENRERIQPAVERMDQDQLTRIDSKRSQYENLDHEDPRLKELKKEMYYQIIHHTVAILGNTMTFSETRNVLESLRPESEKCSFEANEILGLKSAFSFVYGTLATKNEPITLADILEIHRRVMGKIDVTIAGSFRKSQVFVDKHTPPPVSDVNDLMAEFIIFLQSPVFKKMHPVHAAAYAHQRLVYIHPFDDGNGRTARLLMNLLFIKSGYPLVIIDSKVKSIYYKVLQIAHEGDIRPFYRFIALTTEYTIDAFLQAREFELIYNINEFNRIVPLGSNF